MSIIIYEMETGTGKSHHCSQLCTEMNMSMSFFFLSVFVLKLLLIRKKVKSPFCFG